MNLIEHERAAPNAPSNVVGMRFRREGAMVSLPAGRPSVLIVEDSVASADVTGLLLRAAGARVRWADSLAAAYRHLRSFAPEAVVVDPGLPDGSGLDLIARLRQIGSARPRLIVLSGDDQVERAALAAGADLFLAKPAPAATLLRNIVAPQRAGVVSLSGAQATAPSLIADLQRARLHVLRAALAEDEAQLEYPVQFLSSLARNGDMAELNRLLTRLATRADTPRDLAAGLARMIDVLQVRGIPARA